MKDQVIKQCTRAGDNVPAEIKNARNSLGKNNKAQEVNQINKKVDEGINTNREREKHSIKILTRNRSKQPDHVYARHKMKR